MARGRTEEAQAKGVEFQEFLLRACHDLRTPLRAIRANSELLLRSPEKRNTPDFDKILGFIANGAKTLESLVDGMSSYSLALQVDECTFQAVRTDILLRSVLAKLAPDIRASHADVVYDELPRLAGDPDRLMQLFENLLRNAIQHRGAAAPRIHISARQQERDWLFAVRDNGPGIDPEDRERIFRPFETLRRDGTAGVGLGLAACREIVRGHGGRIWAEPGTGCTFFFTLPAGT